MTSLDDLVARISALQERSARRVLIGIAGAPGAGKSHVVALLLARLAGPARPVPDDVPLWADSPVAHVPMDGFHLADSELRRLGRSDRKGAPDTFDVAGYAALLRRVVNGDTCWAPDFRRDLGEPVAQRLPVTPRTRVVLSEGNYLLLAEPSWQAARAHFTEVWFCRADEVRRRDRLIARHIRYGMAPPAAQRFVASSDDRNAELVAPTESSADLVFDVDQLEPPE